MTSTTFRAKAAARAAHAGSSRRRCPYAFMWAPQPAALTTTASTLGGLERGDGGAGEGAGPLGLAGVRVERAAAALGPRHAHLERPAA